MQHLAHEERNRQRATKAGQSHSLTPVLEGCERLTIGALIVRIGVWALYTIFTIRNPQNNINIYIYIYIQVIIQASILGFSV